MIRERLKRKHLADRKPLHEMHTGPGWLWDRNEVAEARKRVAAKHYIRRCSTMNAIDIRDLPTTLLVIIAKSIKQLSLT